MATAFKTLIRLLKSRSTEKSMADEDQLIDLAVLMTGLVLDRTDL